MPMQPYSAERRAKAREKNLIVLAKPLAFACDYCGAGPGELCRTRTGAEISSPGQTHEARLSGGKGRFARYRRFHRA